MHAESIFSQIIELGRVVLLFKAGDRQDPSNYCPISALPSLSEIVKTIIYTRLEKFLETTEQITPRQFGFRKKNNYRRSNLYDGEYKKPS